MGLDTDAVSDPAAFPLRDPTWDSPTLLRLVLEDRSSDQSGDIPPLDIARPPRREPIHGQTGLGNSFRGLARESEVRAGTAGVPDTHQVRHKWLSVAFRRRATHRCRFHNDHEKKVKFYNLTSRSLR